LSDVLEVTISTAHAYMLPMFATPLFFVTGTAASSVTNTAKSSDKIGLVNFKVPFS